MSWMSDAAEEQVPHCHEDHGFGDVEAFFVIADEAAISYEPAEAALDHPAAGNDLEPWISVGSAYDLDHEIEESRLVEESATIVGAIGEEVLHPRPALADRIEDRLRSGAVGNVRRRQVHGEQTPIRVHGDMAFAADDLLSRVITALFRHRRLDGLAVDDARRRTYFPPHPLAIDHQDNVVDGSEQEQTDKAAKPPIDGLPGREVDRKHPPLASRAHHVAQRVDDLPKISRPFAPPLRRSRQKDFERNP